MSDPLQIIVGALVTIASQYVGYVALRRELAGKADKKTVDEHVKRTVLDGVHGGPVRW